ncbi:F-box family protein [Quillaja saponaria]|uniref:F-box family protein n=1 Tax=Quillaja saponaria TaxID=32244 RepID=A0AAD7LTH1_QUISA|nr:F-box family protein [Quillaja saponaria]
MMKLDTKLKLPLRDDKLVPDNEKFDVVNSCNGLICLSGANHENPLVVRNPVTGEFIKLPPGDIKNSLTILVGSGLGFDPKTNQFKVAEMHILGTGSWKSVGAAPFAQECKFPTYLNGAIHWLLDLFDSKQRIVCFDFESEDFELLPFPSSLYDRIETEDKVIRNISFGALRGFLYICDDSTSFQTDIWEMKEYGVPESWSKVLKIDSCYIKQVGFRGQYKLMNFLTNGAVLMYNSAGRLIYFDPKEERIIYLKVQGAQCRCEAIALVPSLISLKDAVRGDDVEVLNVNSR